MKLVDDALYEVEGKASNSSTQYPCRYSEKLELQITKLAQDFSCWLVSDAKRIYYHRVE